MFTPFTRLPVYAPHDDEEMTKQSSKDECDIYQILKQYQRTGVLTHISQQAPRYEDLPDAIDYQASMNLVMEAQATFQTLPASVRDEYSNDPHRFLAAFSDPAQHDRLRDLGLLKPKAPAPTPPAAGPAQEATRS